LKKYLYLLIGVALLMGAIEGNAQTDTCIARLKDAGSNYDQRNYDTAITLLNNTLSHCALEKKDEIQACKMLIMCNLAIDDLEAADVAAERILKTDPNYAPDKFRDDARLIKLFKKFAPVPILTIGLSGGVNLSLPSTVHTFSVVFPDNAAPAAYKKKAGFHVQLQAEKRVFQNFWVLLGLGYRSTSYEHDLYDIHSNTIYYSEKLAYADIPVALKYYIGKGRFTPFVMAGADFSVLVNSLSTTQQPGEKDIINQAARRNSFSTGFLGGVGASYRIKNFKLFADVRYIYFPQDVNKDGTRYTDQVSLFKYYYIDDDFRLDNLQFNVGASFILSYRNAMAK